eukprot:CAMPEP_0171095712 /NCGR_PEP_ID=MMETSP0766_2-20121228/43330_1 /TAXON_ID=439317 /ORGANISM="Gambierdiscus australes, Strain CAWD 149" /LENGTH=37 /DNA_ID= /DNA_START= /DNA_END= /DNA_ORIENTATION=
MPKEFKACACLSRHVVQDTRVTHLHGSSGGGPAGGSS